MAVLTDRDRILRVFWNAGALHRRLSAFVAFCDQVDGDELDQGLYTEAGARAAKEISIEELFAMKRYLKEMAKDIELLEQIPIEDLVALADY